MAALPGQAMTARTDLADRLIEASAPLANLQMRCGGTIPGEIAIPALAELVARARAFGLRLAGPIIAQDGEDEVRAWAEVEPPREPQEGCRIVLRHWQASPLPVEDGAIVAGLQLEIRRALAELTALLDARQAVLSVQGEAADLAELAAAMRAGLGRPWTDFVSIVGDSHRQPLHWRLLDGCRLQIAGSRRTWRASLVPLGTAAASPAGFELALTADQPLPPGGQVEPATAASGPETGAAADDGLLGDRMVGRELAPVLRQPIARIIANAETIRMRLAGPLDEEYAAYAADIATAGAHLLELVDDLTDLEVIESPDFTTAADEIDLGDVARRACGILGVRAREKRIELVPPPEPAGMPARAEFRRVLQVLLNLIGNAIRYSPHDSRIDVSLDSDAGRARVIVADQGPGMSEAQQERIFEKFERLGRSGDGGSGLGLYISRRLARAMGGELAVTSAPGEGARFVLEVPVG